MRVFIPFIIMFACLIMFGMSMIGMGLGLLDAWMGGVTVLSAIAIGWGAAIDLDRAERSM